MKSLVHIGSAGLALAIFTGNAHALTVAGSFDTSAEGWTVTTFADDGRPSFNSVFGVSGVAPTYHAAGGNPGGFISAADPDNGWTYFVAPGAYLGDHSDKVGGRLSFSLQHAFPSSGIVFEPQPPHAVLQGAGLTLVSDAGDPPAITPAWTEYSVSLVPSAWRRTNLTGAAPSEAQFAAALGDLTGLFLSAEFITPVVETNGLDSVSIAPVPLPAAWLGLTSALMALGAWRKRGAP